MTPENERRFWPPNWHFLLVGYLIAAAFVGILILLAFAARAEDYHESYDTCIARLAVAAAYDNSGWLKDHMPALVAQQCGKSPHKDDTAGDVGTQPSLTVNNICVAGIPCGEKTDKETLRAAYTYCQTTLLIKDDRALFVAPQYADSVCLGIVSRWLQSDWKKAEEASDKAIREKEIAHAKAFVEAVARQK